MTNNKVALLELIRSWILEDKDRAILPDEQEEEDKLLARIIDEHRDRKLFEN
jgi:hypothetical protein